MLTLPLQSIERLVDLTSTGLTLHPEITKEESEQVFRTIAAIDASVDFLIGDWMLQHSERWGREDTERILTQLEFDFVRAIRAERVAKIPKQNRNPRLTAKHHHAVARTTDDPKEQQAWLQTAEEKNLSPDELARSVRKGSIVRNTERKAEFSSMAGLPVSIEAVNLSFTRWLTYVEKNDPICDWDRRRLEDLSRELMPMAETYARIKALLDKG